MCLINRASRTCGTGVEISDTQKVLDGDIDSFLEAALKMQS